VLGQDPNVFFGITDLVPDPSNLNRYYLGSFQGVFRSDDGGATWINVSNNDPTLASFVQQGRTKLGVGRDGRVYVAVIGGDLLFIAFTTDRGGHWTAMDLPRTPSLVGGPPDGTNPDKGDKLSVRHFGPIVAPGEPENDGDDEPGGQGFLHFAIAVDPGNSSLVYVGGDRQPLPSFIGATNFTGRLFRGNTTIEPTGAIPSPQWAHITNSNAIPPNARIVLESRRCVANWTVASASLKLSGASAAGSPPLILPFSRLANRAVGWTPVSRCCPTTTTTALGWLARFWVI